MKIVAKKVFEKQALKMPKAVRIRLKELYLKIEHANRWSEIPAIKKMRGEENLYRIRLGDYRVGAQVVGDVVKLIIIKRRKEIYRFFP